MDKIRATIVYQIDAERGRQENLWGSGFDDRNTPNDWATIVTHYATRAAMCSQRWTGVRPDCRVVLDVVEYRRNLVKAAAVCVAAIEALDRGVEAPGRRHYDSVPCRALPEDADVMTIKKFMNACKAGAFCDDDGTAYYATETMMSDVSVLPSVLATRSVAPFIYSHVVWIAK